MGPTSGAPAMAVEKDKLRAAALAIAATCFFALAISIGFIKQFFINRKRKKSCYLNTEPKPQYGFKRVLADNSYSQFKHLKLHTADAHSDEEFSNSHPYKGEISKIMKNPNVGFLEFLEKSEKGTLEMEGSYVWVETETQLKELVEVLSNERVFAVDTEQHSFRSFLGFTALVQISTISEDYLVDTIALHDVMGLLRPVFANPGICKVFHGADNDVLWLQRDFHIYVVNLFDTAKACDILSKPQRSLAYLLETYCGVSTNKLLQREDWRQRPLPQEMIQYARADAHYLLYIAYCLCLELKQQKNVNSGDWGPIHWASRRSNATCLQLFAKDIEACPGELAASSIVSRCLNDQGNISSSLCDAKFQELVRRLCLWRDIMARLHDESLRFVLSENAIIELAAEIPTTETDICSSISKADLDVESTILVPLQSPSPVVCCHLEDLLCLLQEDTTIPENIFQVFIHQHLGSAGSCPLSAYNYALLSKTSLGLNHRSTSNRNGFRASKQVAKKASRELYVSRNLAKLVEDDPPSIMLLFEPKGRPEDEDNDFYIQSKKNICVGCGEGKHYLRYRIIPSCYRMHFPEHLKSHRSHDIVLLCVDCHEIAHAAAEKYKRQIAAEFGIPLFIQKVVDIDNTQNIPASSLPIASSEEIGVSPLQLRTAAMALLRHGPQMPSQRREELTQIVMTYYGGREISDEDLERALLVGMTPHERRRFEKREGESVDSLNANLTETGQKQDFVDNSMVEDTGISTQPLSSHNGGDVTIFTADTDDLTSDLDLVPGSKCISVSKDDGISGSGNLSNEMTSPADDRDISLKHESKLSLLGHGPHGKMVVMHLLKEYGEDGIRDFCQRWRQVFVEALHPRFLPAGWDVMHSGRRDFGEFSVYNPTKKASVVAAEG
ncbi:hypothetical protein DH2020_031532 [Rehmannia glutinosa]|uniref:HRDC domain-containing protein n=1 Tax=Rehmannia glutinosa TaxID=99300 RepID=A0ABR0VK14_REHGL